MKFCQAERRGTRCKNFLTLSNLFRTHTSWTPCTMSVTLPPASNPTYPVRNHVTWLNRATLRNIGWSLKECCVCVRGCRNKHARCCWMYSSPHVHCHWTDWYIIVYISTVTEQFDILQSTFPLSLNSLIYYSLHVHCHWTVWYTSVYMSTATEKFDILQSTCSLSLNSWYTTVYMSTVTEQLVYYRLHVHLH